MADMGDGKRFPLQGFFGKKVPNSDIGAYANFWDKFSQYWTTGSSPTFGKVFGQIGIKIAIGIFGKVFRGWGLGLWVVWGLICYAGLNLSVKDKGPAWGSYGSHDRCRVGVQVPDEGKETGMDDKRLAEIRTESDAIDRELMTLDTVFGRDRDAARIETLQVRSQELAAQRRMIRKGK